MKFKSTIIDIPSFAKITQSLSYVAKTALIRFQPDAIVFIIQGSTQVWATIDKETLCSQYVVESIAGNIINVEVNLDHLARLLKSISETGQVLMKLTKRDKFPMLSFNSEFFGKQGGHNSITHDIHIRVLSNEYISAIVEPGIPDPEVVICLPNLHQLSQISNNLRQLSDKITVSANGAGELSIAISTPSVSTTSSFKDLPNPVLENSENGRDKHIWSRLKVDAKEWCNFLRIGSLAKRVIACLCEDHAMVLYVYISAEDDEHSCVMTYYLPTYQE